MVLEGKAIMKRLLDCCSVEEGKRNPGQPRNTEGRAGEWAAAADQVNGQGQGTAFQHMLIASTYPFAEGHGCIDVVVLCRAVTLLPLYKLQ